MFKNEYFRFTLISIIFSLAVLVALPRIPVVINNKYLRMTSYIGGYEIKIPKKDGETVIDLKDFKKSFDIGESQKVVYKVETEELEDEKKVLDTIINITENRLKSSGILDFQVGVENEDERKMYVLTSKDTPSDRILNLVIGTGRLNFKSLKNPEEWSLENIASFYLEIDRWEDSDVTEVDIKGLRYYKDATGMGQLHIMFQPEGRRKFYKLAGENIGSPVGLFINGYEYPFAMPVISKDILSNPSVDPAMSGNFSQQVIDDFILQMKTPLPTTLTYVEDVLVEPKMGNDFLYKYSLSFLISLVIICGFFIFKFGYLGIIYNVSFFMSLIIFSALSKIFSLTISVPSMVGLILIVIFLSDIGYTVLREIKIGMSQNKPFDLLLYQSFGKDKEKLETPVIFVFLLTTILYFFTSGNIKSIMSFLTIGMLVVIFFYSFLLRNFLGFFGRKKG